MYESPKPENYAAALRRNDPERMKEMENMVRAYYAKLPYRIESDPSTLSDFSVSMIANGVMNRMKKFQQEYPDASKEELNKEIDSVLLEAVSTRIDLMRKEHEEKPQDFKLEQNPE